MSLRKRHSATRRWGFKTELDGRFRVGSPGYNAYPLRLKHLSAWYASHKLAGSHLPVHMAGVRLSRLPSSDMTLRQKEAFVRRRS